MNSTPTFTPASTNSLMAFMAIVLFVICFFCFAVYITTQRVSGDSVAKKTCATFSLGLFLWLSLVMIAVNSGVFLKNPFPSIPIAFFTIMAVSLLFAFSSTATVLAHHLPFWALVGFQAFRLPLELVLHAWAEQGTIPESMTWTGSNIDIISGIVALLLMPFAKHHLMAWIANIIGIVLLLNVARVALFSAPVPFGWPVEPKLMLIAYLPYALIVPVCVAGALVGHVVLTRKLLQTQA